jgi:hypothetical protein
LLKGFDMSKVVLPQGFSVVRSVNSDVDVSKPHRG